MAELDLITLVDGVPSTETAGEVATISKLVKTAGEPADDKSAATDTTPATHTAILKQISASIQALAGLIDSDELEVKDGAAATALGSILAALGGTLTVDTGLSGLATDAKLDTIISHVDGLEGKDFATQATLASVLSALGSLSVTANAGTNLDTSALATQTTLAAVLAKIIAAPATEAKQDVSIARLALFHPVDGETVAITSTADESSPLAAGRIWIKPYGCDCHIQIGASPTATSSTSPPLTNGQDYYFDVEEGDEVSVIRAGSTDGTLYISTETAIPA